MCVYIDAPFVDGYPIYIYCVYIYIYLFIYLFILMHIHCVTPQLVALRCRTVGTRLGFCESHHFYHRGGHLRRQGLCGSHGKMAGFTTNKWRIDGLTMKFEGLPSGKLTCSIAMLNYQKVTCLKHPDIGIDGEIERTWKNDSPSNRWNATLVTPNSWIDWRDLTGVSSAVVLKIICGRVSMEHMMIARYNYVYAWRYCNFRQAHILATEIKVSWVK